jgi:uncharacterized protein YjbI with pentapeptide repeats
VLSPEQYSERLLVAVNAAADAVSSRFVTFVSVGAYVAVTVASTTHEMLLRAASVVTLPLLNAQIPIIGAFGFYTIAPWLIVLLHSDLLLQLSILSNEIERFDEETSKLPDDQQSMLRQRIANFYYVLYLAGQAPSRFLHVFSGLITWLTTVVLPLALLLWIQIRFLPFHSPFDTWLHRAAILADVALIVFILMPRLWSHWRAHDERPPLQGLLRRLLSVPALILAACLVATGVSLFVVRIPDEADKGPTWFAQNMQLRERVLTANALSPEDVNALRDSPPEKLTEVLSKVTPFQALQGRDFRFADLYNAVLPKLDLRAVRTVSGPSEPLPADCESRRGCVDPPECIEAGLDRTRLAGANFGWASMQQAMLDDAVLEGADLSWAKVQFGSFTRANLNTAKLSSARLASARFDHSKACGASFDEAEMPGTSLVGAHLRGASLRGANLAKANFEGADLRGADLSGANLSGAVLRNAQLEGAAFRGAKMDGVVLEGANVEKTDLSSGGATAAVTAYLVTLACEDAATANGIVSQALHSQARDRAALATALMEARSRGDCQGMGSMTAETAVELAARVNVPEH